jgi:hypothetical protein
MNGPAKLDVVFAALVADLASIRVAYAVVGGLAVGARAVERMTKDVDVAVAVGNEAEAEALLSALSGRGYRVVEIFEQGATGRLSTVRTTSPVDGVTRVDFLFASSGIEVEIVGAADDTEVLGSKSRVARAEHLVVAKLLSRREGRPQDEMDLAALVPRLNDDELKRVREAIELVVSRGMNRGRNLMADFDAALARYRG